MEAYTYKMEEILKGMIYNNPFWETYITIEGEVEECEDGYMITFDDGSSLPIKTNDKKPVECGKRKLSGFLNYASQEGFGAERDNRIDSIKIQNGKLAFDFYPISEEKKVEYYIKTRQKHPRDIYMALQRIWSSGKKARISIVSSDTSVAYNDIMAGIHLNDILDVERFYSIEKKEIKFESANHNKANLVKKFVKALAKAEKDSDIVVVSRGGFDKGKGYGILEEDEVKQAIVYMTKITICAVGHVDDNKDGQTFHQVFDYDAQTPSLAGVRLREWLLAYKTTPRPY